MNLETIARERCARILETKAAQEMPRGTVEALVIIAFMYGAAWALDCGDVLEISDAVADSLRSVKQ